MGVASKRAVFLGAAVVIAAVLIVYAPILGFNFVHRDDRLNIFQNPYLMPPISGEKVGYFWQHAYYFLYMPLTFSLWALCAQIGALPKPIPVPGGDTTPFQPAVFHLVSLLLHAASAVLVFLLLNRLLPEARQRSSAIGASAVGALLFALHPLQVESVAWATGMNNLTGGFFSLLALLEYVRWAQEDRRRPLHFVLATVFFILALLSKPSSAAVPLIAAALDWGALKRPPARWARPVAFWLLLALVCAVGAHFAAPAQAGDVFPPILARPLIAADALAWYFGKIIWPQYVSPEAGRPFHLVLDNWWGYVTWLAPVGLGVLLWRAGERARFLQASYAVFIAAVLPMLGFVPYYATHFSTVADRYLYVALLGLSMAVAWSVDRIMTLPTSSRTARGVTIGVVALVLALFTLRTIRQIPVWHNTFTLAFASLVTDPTDTTAHVNVAIWQAAHGDVPGAILHLREAARLKPDDAAISLYLGRTLQKTGDLAGAIPPLQNALKQEPRSAEAALRLGVCLASTGRIAEAVAPLKTGLALRPGEFSTRYILAISLGNLHRDAEAAAEMQQVVALHPAFLDAAYSLGRLQERLGKRAEAADAYRTALLANPSDTSAQQALSRLSAH